MLSEYKGHVGSIELFKALVGEKIKTTFRNDRDLYIVTESGSAIVIDNGGSVWVIGPDEVQTAYAIRRQTLEGMLAELDSTGIDSSPVTDGK